MHPKLMVIMKLMMVISLLGLYVLCLPPYTSNYCHFEQKNFSHEDFEFTNFYINTLEIAMYKDT